VEKLLSVLKKDGLIKTVNKVFRYVYTNYLSKVDIISYMTVKINNKKYNNELDEILGSNYDRIIIWRSSFGWNVPLFQRPQHISVNLAKNNCLMLYEVTKMTDKIKTIKKQSENLYLVNFNNRAINKMIFKKLEKVSCQKYIQIYSTDCRMPLQELKEYINKGYKVIYEYIDDLSPELIGSKTLPQNLIEKYNYILEDKENVFVVVTAEELKKDILAKRGNEKLVFSSNGVDYQHFQEIDLNYKYDEEFNKILHENKKIVGYYGALASWFDYNMLKYLAEERPEYNIVLFGIKYDDTYDKSSIKEQKNIYFLGSKSYNELQNYASKFDVCVIPFLINNITKATSPVKLFEYMALHKPIVTTAMDECQKYESVYIAENKEEFVKLVDQAVNLTNENAIEYFNILKKEALENTWEEKAKRIIEVLQDYENHNQGG